MEAFQPFINAIDDPNQRQRVKEVLNWVNDTFENLKPEFKWNQPMFTDHGTFIIAFSVASKHMSVGLEGPEIPVFSKAIKQAGYAHSKKIFRIPFDMEVNYDLLRQVIEYNINEKQDTTTFWRR